MSKKTLIIALVVVVALLIVAIVGLAMSANSGTEKTSTQDSVSTRDSVEATMITSSHDVTEESKVSVNYEEYNKEKYENVSEYIHSDDNSYYKDLNDPKPLKDTVSDADEKFEITVEDDRTLVYNHALVPMSNEGYDSYINSLKEYLDSPNLEKIEVLKTIKTNTNIDNPRIIERYYKNDGTLALEKEFSYNDLVK